MGFAILAAADAPLLQRKTIRSNHDHREILNHDGRSTHGGDTAGGVLYEVDISDLRRTSMNWLMKLLVALKIVKRKTETKPLPPVITDDQSTGGAETKPATNAADVVDIPCAGLPVTATISNVKHGNGKTTWTMTGTDSWPKKTVKKVVQGKTHLYVWRDGKWHGGKFDWFRPWQTSKGHENIEAGYMDVTPVKGDRVAFGLIDIHDAQRSNFVEGVWP